jgi:hypothetical protein
MILFYSYYWLTSHSEVEEVGLGKHHVACESPFSTFGPVLSAKALNTIRTWFFLLPPRPRPPLWGRYMKLWGGSDIIAT